MKRHRLNGLGAAVADGVCSPHPHIAPRPSSIVLRLQRALNSLAHRTGDSLVGTTADGLVGPHTVKTANRALYMYARGGAPSEFTTGKLTHAQVRDFAPQLAAYVDKAPIASAARVTSAPTALPGLVVPQISPSQASVPSSGGTMPYSYPAAYPYPAYPPSYAPYYYSNMAPGGLPPDRASVDVKAFIPAQYEHVQVDPMAVIAALIVGAGIFVVVTKKKARD